VCVQPLSGLVVDYREDGDEHLVTLDRDEAQHWVRLEDRMVRAHATHDAKQIVGRCLLTQQSPTKKFRSGGASTHRLFSPTS
jgi:hypothetical protein